jgi:hypothetical protein
MNNDTKTSPPADFNHTASMLTSVGLTVSVRVEGTIAVMFLAENGKEPFEIERGTWDGRMLDIAANPGEDGDECDDIFDWLDLQLRAAQGAHFATKAAQQ